MARFKATMAVGEKKSDVAIAVYVTGNASADVEVNVNDATVTTMRQLVQVLEDIINAIRDDETGYPPV